MAKTAIAVLEHGIRRDGATAHDAELRAVTGNDELALAELAASSIAAKTTELLALTPSGSVRRPVNHEEIRALSVGDRGGFCLSFTR